VTATARFSALHLPPYYNLSKEIRIHQTTAFCMKRTVTDFSTIKMYVHSGGYGILDQD